MLLALQYGGSFKTLREATIRKTWIGGELAALRVPDLRLLSAEATKVPALVEAAAAWRASRVDVVQQTQNMHRSAIGRIFKVQPKLHSRPGRPLTS